MQTNLTSQQIQDALDQLRLAYLSGTLEVRFSDGKSKRFQNMSDIRTAIQTGEDWLRQVSGTKTSRVSLAQHKRGDGPTGPSALAGLWCR